MKAEVTYCLSPLLAGFSALKIPGAPLDRSELPQKGAAWLEQTPLILREHVRLSLFPLVFGSLVDLTGAIFPLSELPSCTEDAAVVSSTPGSSDSTAQAQAVPLAGCI